MLGFWKKLLIVLCLLLPILAAVGWHIVIQTENDYFLELTVEGEPEIILEYGQHFHAPKASAVYWGSKYDKEPIPVKVKRKGSVDETQLGTYVLEYSAKAKGMTQTRRCTVHVVDTVPPQITLVSDPMHYTRFGYSYEEEGYTATDNYDGDLTGYVYRNEKDGKIIYSVFDSAGNVGTAVRYITYGDEISPRLQLTGGPEITVLAGETFRDPGCTAMDDGDGDLTAGITVTGHIDPYKPGTYSLTYQVSDSTGNIGAAIRTVTVEPQPPQTDTEDPEKVIYLTFDDGPGPRTPELLEILKKYNIKATFFVVNTGCIGTIAQTAQEGHVVAIHSATHNFRQIYSSEEAYYSDLNKIQSIIKHYTGQEAKLLRFPGGASNTISRFNPGIMTRLTASVEAKGFRYYDWNVDSNDAGGATTSTEVFHNVINGVQKHKTSVVLQHDIKGFSIDAVERIINWGLANGYTFLPLSEDSPPCEHRVNN